MTDEGAAVGLTMTITNIGERQMWRWALGKCAVALSFPVSDVIEDDVARDLDFLIHSLPQMVESGVTEAEVEVFKQELERELP